MQRTPDTVRSIDDCTTAFKPRCLVQSSSENDISTQEQDNQAQISALQSAGCELIFQEKASGGRWDRPELHRLLGHLRKADV
ncbi:recombinase family protein, partial [Burkholderia cenocepacia]|uniref:recombinase family protein n=1 Tax=Burkholderia cenocepacia TaxID=95486 RepID=UPI00222E4742